MGYGVDASQKGHPAFAFDGRRKTSKSPFRSLAPNWLYLSMNTNATGEGGVCYGDSGSPHFIDGAPGMAVATTTGGDTQCRSLNYDFRLDTPTARNFLGQFVTLP